MRDSDLQFVLSLGAKGIKSGQLTDVSVLLATTGTGLSKHTLFEGTLLVRARPHVTCDFHHITFKEDANGFINTLDCAKFGERANMQ